MIRLCCIAIGYLCGLFQTSYIIGRMYHTDIREHGSGNAGTTNALRTLGKKAGLLTLLGDLCKPMLAYLIIYLLFHGSYPDLWKLLCMYGCAGAVLGHVFPFYLGFKGGKGIASIAGLGIIFGNVPIILSCMLVFILVVAITRYVSLGSIVMMLLFLIEVVVFGQLGWFPALSGTSLYEWYGIVAVLVALTIYKHRENIKRLFAGNEKKLSFSKNGGESCQK